MADRKPTRGNGTEPHRGEVLLYQAADGAVRVDCLLKQETLWLTQKALAELFAVQRPAVTKHLGNIFATGELVEDSVCSILEHTAADGKTYKTKYYNLDAIIAVGYRVNSYQATQFRIWATRILKEYMIKGFTLDLGFGTSYWAWHPVGMPASSRWLSVATPPESSLALSAHPSRGDRTAPGCHPCRGDDRLAPYSGGVASLNHRLLAGILQLEDAAKPQAGLGRAYGASLQAVQPDKRDP